MSNYCYKVKSNFLKKRKDDSRNIEEYFNKFESTEGEEEIYAIKYRLTPESPIVQGYISLMNDPKWQESAKLKDNLEKFAKNGLEFVEIFDTEKKENFFKFVETEESLKDFEMIRICVDVFENETKGLLFILTNDGCMTYFNTKILDENIPDIIETLKKEGVIYKVLAPGEKARRERKKCLA